MSITHFLRILLVRRNLILITLVAALLAAAAVIKIVPPRYTATSRVMLDIIKPDPVTGVAMSAQYARAFVATQIELIRDYRVAGRVVDGFDWTSSPALARAFQSAKVGEGISFRRWLSQKVVDGTKAELIPGSNILEISYTSDNPESAAKVADAVRDAYEAETRQMKQRSAMQSAQWFTQQSTKLKAALTDAEAKKAEFERKNDIVINEDLSDSETSRLQAMSGVADPVAPPMVASGPAISPSQGQLAQIDAQIATASRTLGPNHPQIVALKQQRAVVAQNVARELSAGTTRIVGGGGPSAQARFAAQQAKVLGQRGKLAEGRQLAMNVVLLRDQVAKAEKRTDELEQQAESDETGLSMLGSAVIPQSPSFPKIPLLILGAIALGLTVGVLLAVLVEMLARKVRGPSDLIGLGVPLLGVATLPVARSNRLARLPEWSQRFLPANMRAAA